MSYFCFRHTPEDAGDTTVHVHSILSEQLVAKLLKRGCAPLHFFCDIFNSDIRNRRTAGFLCLCPDRCLSRHHIFSHSPVLCPIPQMGERLRKNVTKSTFLRKSKKRSSQVPTPCLYAHRQMIGKMHITKQQAQKKRPIGALDILKYSMITAH